MSINSIFAGSTPNSRDTIRQQYLNNLTLDIANQTKNLNANKLFKANGSTGSEPADTRSATERYEDIDGLKVQCRAGLRQITDPAEAERIVADITTAELQFLAGHLPFIVADLKPKWALGVPAGSFLPYFRKLMRKNIETEGVEYGLQSSATVGGGVATLPQNLIRPEDIEDAMRTLQRQNMQRELLGNVRRQGARDPAILKKQVEQALHRLSLCLPTAELRQQIEASGDADFLEYYDDEVADLTSTIPSYNILIDACNLPPSEAPKAVRELLDGISFEGLEALKRQATDFAMHHPTLPPPEETYQEEQDTEGLTPLGGDTMRSAVSTSNSQLLHQAENDGTMLPSDYVNRPNVAEKFRQLTGFSEQIPPEDFYEQTYDTKLELLRTYADQGIFNHMDATFMHMINAILEGHDVPERDMDMGYAKYFRLRQLGAFSQPEEMASMPASKSFQTEALLPREQYPPTRAPYEFQTESEFPEEEAVPTAPPSKYLQPPYSNFSSLSSKSKRLLITQMLSKSEFSDFPDFEDVATEIVSTKNVPDEFLSNFFNAFLHHIGVGGSPLVAMPAMPEEVEAEEFTIIPQKKEKKLPQIQEEREYNPVDIEEFRQLSRDRQKSVLQTLLDAPPEVQTKIDKLASIPQKKTMEYLYEQYLLYRPSGVALTSSALKGKAEPESSGKKASSTEGTTEAEQYTSPSKSLSGATEVLGAVPKAEKAVRSSSKVHYPKTVSEYQGLNITQQKAILDRAYGDGVVDSDDLDPERATEIQDLIRSDKFTKAQSKEIYASLLPVIRDLQSQGMIGIGLKKKAVSNDVIHIDFEKGSLPKGRPKKSKNIIFGMGLSSVVSQPRVRMEGKNIDFSKGISAEPSYVPFGTHLLNRHKLKDNVVMMRTKKGGAIVNIPTQKVSPKLAKVLHVISGGGVPQFESVMDLAEGDKALLHKIARTSKVSDHLSVPNPNKTKMEEEDNRFNILRGEVAIGNDNPAVIKEFKVLLLKFMREGRVPIGQGKEIMEELLLLGY